MYQYTNGYNCAIDTGRQMVSIRFFQNIPSFDEKGDLSDSEIEEVTSIVMSMDMARALGNALSSIMEDDDAVEEGPSET